MTNESRTLVGSAVHYVLSNGRHCAAFVGYIYEEDPDDILLIAYFPYFPAPPHPTSPTYGTYAKSRLQTAHGMLHRIAPSGMITRFTPDPATPIHRDSAFGPETWHTLEECDG